MVHPHNIKRYSKRYRFGISFKWQRTCQPKHPNHSRPKAGFLLGFTYYIYSPTFFLLWHMALTYLYSHCKNLTINLFGLFFFTLSTLMKIIISIQILKKISLYRLELVWAQLIYPKHRMFIKMLWLHQNVFTSWCNNYI